MNPDAGGRQFIRFGVVGLASNLLLYLLYLGLTAVDFEPKRAMSLAYAIGVLQTFVFNKQWTFGHRGQLGASFARYLGVYAVGYLLNLAVLMVAVDRLGYPHQWVQGLMILLLAAFLFLMQKFFVFKPAKAA